MNKISTNNAPSAIGPYSQAVVCGGLVYTSGQIAIEPQSNNIIATTIQEQTHQVCANLKAVLEASSSSLDNVVKTTCFLADMSDFGAFNEIYAQYFINKPARSCVAVKTLPRNVLVEIDCIAKVEQA